MSNTEEIKSEEIFLQGIPASPGAAIGSAYIHRQEEITIPGEQIEEEQVSAHLELLDQAQKKLTDQWQHFQDKQRDEKTKNILAAQIEIIRDPELANRIKVLIEEEYLDVRQAISEAFEEYIDLFSKSGSPVNVNRLIDLTDIRDRLIEAVDDKVLPIAEKKGDIVVAEDISPREIIQLSHQSIKGIIMEQGGNSSHAAIIARSVGIPAVVGAKDATKNISDKTKVCLDGERGLISVNPDSSTCTQVQKRIASQMMSNEEKDHICALPSLTDDGHPFTLRANIEFPDELTHVQQCKAEGIGLLRTESLYLNRRRFGSSHNQQLFYESILEKTRRKPVTIRLFDVGGDKFQSQSIIENNPFLGWRGIRMLLDERELLREQLTAILAAAGNHPGKVKILLPMVTMFDEIEGVKAEIAHCRQRLFDEEEAVDRDIPLGMMVETPSAALQAEQFAEKVDFFSIGTNDLIQYLLAVDRGNARISHLYNQIHPVMWQMIRGTVNAAHKHEIKVEVCGELASYPVAAACLLGLGIDGLSMTPASIPRVKKRLTTSTFDEMKDLADRVMECVTPHEVETLFYNWKENN